MGKRHHQVVKVLDDGTLVDSSFLEYPYVTKNGQPLEPGYYLVLRPPHRPAQRYDLDAT